MPALQRLSIRLNLVLLFIVVVLLVTQMRTWQELQNYKAGTPTALPQSSETIFSDAETSCTATVNVRHLNQRSGPGQHYPITGAARNGQMVNGIGWDNTQEWLLVSTSSGSAWMYARYLTLAGSCEDLPISEISETAALSESQIQPRRGRHDSEIVQPSAAPELTPQAAVSTPAAQTATTALSPIFTAEVQYWAEQIMRWSATYQLDSNLIATVIQIESCGDPTVSSSAGAQGLFQVMPFHFAAGEDMLNIETNARRGLTYLQGALELSNGDVGLALVGYNGGYGVIDGNWAAETRRYYYWGSGIYAEAVSGAAVSPTLQEWLTAGGSSLCARASASQTALP